MAFKNIEKNHGILFSEESINKKKYTLFFDEKGKIKEFLELVEECLADINTVVNSPQIVTNQNAVAIYSKILFKNNLENELTINEVKTKKMKI
jgi:hypothetical protein